MDDDSKCAHAFAGGSEQARTIGGIPVSWQDVLLFFNPNHMQWLSQDFLNDSINY
jgi:hypothetical protein